MKVSVNSSFKLEKEYIIETLLSDFLGVAFELSIDSSVSDYIITLDNGNQIIIKDTFFSKFSENSGYLRDENIPDEVTYAKNQFTPEADIPIIFGSGTIDIRENKGKRILTCGIDIFASSFFMLTRWEEHVNKTRDAHNRFPATGSLAYKNGFLDRPVVNEYTEMLWNMLRFLGCKQERKKREYKLVLTHDVDTPLRWPNAFKAFSNIGGDLLIRRDVAQALNTSKNYLLTKLGRKKDPYDTFDFLMDESERLGIKSHFFFKGGGDSSHDSKYNLRSNFIKDVIAKIDKRGHLVGFHTSYDAYNDEGLWEQEYEILQKVSPQDIEFVRDHFLRFEVPKSWEIADNFGISWDSSLGYADYEGFRCGTCYDFPVFDILRREKLNLREKPLIVMDTTLLHYQEYTSKEILEKISMLHKRVKKYEGDFVLLWHNSSLLEENPELYKSILNLIGD